MAVGVAVLVEVGVGVGGGRSANDTAWTVSLTTVSGTGLVGLEHGRTRRHRDLDGVVSRRNAEEAVMAGRVGGGGTAEFEIRHGA